MSPTNEQIMAEVRRRTPAVFGKELQDTIIEVMREVYTPPEPEPEPEPEPVDPDILAFREWVKSYQSPSILESDPEEIAFLAGARMAAERERERARPLVEYIEADERRLDGVAHRQARDSLAKYRGEA